MSDWRASRFWLASTNRARKMASSETVMVRKGNGNGSKGSMPPNQPTIEADPHQEPRQMRGQHRAAGGDHRDPIAQALRPAALVEQRLFPALDRLDVLVERAVPRSSGSTSQAARRCGGWPRGVVAAGREALVAARRVCPVMPWVWRWLLTIVRPVARADAGSAAATGSTRFLGAVEQSPGHVVLIRSILGPGQQPVERPAVDDALGRNPGQPRVGHGDVGIGQLVRRVRVAVEREQAAGGQRARARVWSRSWRDGSPSISTATPRAAAASNTAATRRPARHARRTCGRAGGPGRGRAGSGSRTGAAPSDPSVVRSAECGAARTSSNACRSSTVTSRPPSARRLASTPRSNRNRPA